MRPINLAIASAAFFLAIPRVWADGGPAAASEAPPPHPPAQEPPTKPPEAAGAPRVKPIALAELDYRVHAAKSIEGEDGFAPARMRLGARADLAAWLRLVAQAEWATDKPALLDAYVDLGPFRTFSFRFGASKTPLFASSRDETVDTLPVPERSMMARAFWPGRDFGLEVRRSATRALPLDAWLRVGNGAGRVLGNDNSDYALDARLDIAFGRALPEAPGAPFLGLRLGAGIHLESAKDRLGVTPDTADGFVFYRAPTVSGPRRVVEAHTVVFAGPIRLLAEIALAKEGRSKDTDGNPDTPREEQEATQSRGASVELAWMITGQRRKPGQWPVSTPFGAWDWGGLEVAGRFERLDLGLSALDVQPGGATSGSAAVRWWATSYLAVSAAWYVTSYDTPPIEEPDRTSSWVGLFRVTARAP